MTYLEAAIAVLRDAKQPLTTRQVTDSAIVQGLIEPTGKTPDASMSAVLYAALRSGSDLVKLETIGTKRAVRGTVRWTVRPGRRSTSAKVAVRADSR
ncbi:MAG: winged helix-turn-helix domain-containing protein [Chloroflexi bacterium]|nr:winged helix-turn-helix domain-containing protein [Chloroflexota bacterium]